MRILGAAFAVLSKASGGAKDKDLLLEINWSQPEPDERGISSITLLCPEANLHGRDASATWPGRAAQAAQLSSKARCMRHSIGI